MKLHLIRHAQAIERSTGLPDEHRPLTCRGRKRFRRVAACLKKTGIDPDVILTSPMVRAVQTAEILSETVHYNGEIHISPQLAAGPDLDELGALLRARPEFRELVVIGHEPALGELLDKLLRLSSPCHLAKGSVVSLKISLWQSGLSAGLVSVVSGGGKEIRTAGAALDRLMGTQHPDKEEVTV